MTTGVTSGNTHPPSYHGQARYRVNEHGTHVVIVPAHCADSRHVLTASGYKIVETSDTLTVTCCQCVEESRAEHSWVLATGGREAHAAEFDDLPYTNLLTRSFW